LSSKVLLSCLMLAVLPALGDERLETLPAILYTTFQKPAPVAVIHALEDEVESIMGPLGRHFAWRTIAGVKGNEISAELAVLTFKGHCDISGIVAKDIHPGALGWTHVSDGAILPFSDIDCDRIRLFLQKELLYFPATDRETLYGRAVARVVAHELYHIFANTSHHGSDGVGKAAYSVQELLSDDFQFEEREGHALRSTASKAHGAQPVGTGKNLGHGF
jgi:hypothetical protein